MSDRRDPKRRPETLVGGVNLMTPHAPEHYPGMRVVRPNDAWPWIILMAPGQTLTGRGGERLLAYRTVDGRRAQGFILEPGDRATLLRTGLPGELAEWRLARAGVVSPEPPPQPAAAPASTPAELTCEQLVEFLGDYLEGSLPEAQQRAFHHHLAQCPACVAYLETYRATIALGREATADDVDGQLPDELVNAILASCRRPT